MLGHGKLENFCSKSYLFIHSFFNEPENIRLGYHSLKFLPAKFGFRGQHVAQRNRLWTEITFILRMNCMRNSLLRNRCLNSSRCRVGIDGTLNENNSPFRGTSSKSHDHRALKTCFAKLHALNYNFNYIIALLPIVFNDSKLFTLLFNGSQKVGQHACLYRNIFQFLFTCLLLQHTFWHFQYMGGSYKECRIFYGWTFSLKDHDFAPVCNLDCSTVQQETN